MKQILHIFAKDTRRLWPEILLSLAALAAMVIVYPMQWKSPMGGLEIEELNHWVNTRMLMNTVCSLLVLLCWALLIARVIQEEPLAGDRQFWITRPYGWKQLLTAKMLFVAVYLIPPLAAAQCLCLISAGLHPLDGTASIATFLFILTGLVIFPVAALATVTASNSKLIFTAAGALLCVLVASGFEFQQTLMSMSFFAQLERFWNAAVILSVLCLAVIVLQYATRKTILSRSILLAGAVALAVASHLSATRPHAKWMPRASDFTLVAQSPFQLTSAVTEQQKISTWVTKDYDHQPVVDVRIPMILEDSDPNSAMHLEMFGVEFEAPDGYRWSTMQNQFWPTEYRAKAWFRPGFFMPVAVYDRLKQGPATMKLTLYYDELQVADIVRSTVGRDSYDLFGTVHCSPGFYSDASLQCRTTVQHPPFIRVGVELATSPCPASQPELRRGGNMLWSGAAGFSPHNLIPLREFWFAYGHDDDTSIGKHLCAGAPLTFTRYRIARRAQASYTISGFQLPPAPRGWPVIKSGVR